MLQAADVERLDVAFLNRARFKAVGLLTVVDGAVFGDKIALILVPAVLVRMTELAGLEREVSALGPAARPGLSFLQRNPVKVKVGRRDFTRVAVGVGEVEDVRIRLLGGRDEVGHHLGEVAIIAATQVNRLVCPLRQIGVDAHVHHREARVVAVFAEVHRLQTLEGLALLAWLEQRVLRIPVEGGRRRDNGDAVLGKILEILLVQRRIEARLVGELDAIIADASQELRAIAVATKIVGYAVLLLVSVHEDFALVAPDLAKPELDIFVGNRLAIDFRLGFERIEITATEFPCNGVLPVDGRLDYARSGLEGELARDFLHHLAGGVQHLRRDDCGAVVRDGDLRFYRQLLLPPGSVREDVFDAHRRLGG